MLAKSVFRLVLERATDASTAIALCKSELFDIAFLNCTASRHDASAIVKRITKHNPAIKIVMMTSEDSWNRQDAATQLGAAAFVEKPFSAEQVDAVLHRLYGLPVPALQRSEADNSGDLGSLVA